MTPSWRKGKHVGSTTSRCSGNEPALLPRTDTAGSMSLLLSITTNQIVACSNREGSKNLFSWSRFQKVDAKVLFDLACDCVLECFKSKNLKYLQRIVLA